MAEVAEVVVEAEVVGAVEPVAEVAEAAKRSFKQPFMLEDF